MSLRAALIEAGAVALSKHHWPVRWDRPENIEACEVEARLVVDAVLDVLADRADETVQATSHDGMKYPIALGDCEFEGLIAVLRGDTGER